MKLSEAQALLERCFTGMAEGAARLTEPSDARFALRPSAVWLEYRWYVQGRGLAEVFLKWDRVRPEQEADAEATVLRIHLLGASPELAACAQRALEGGRPSPQRILGLFGDDGVRRECVSFGRTSVTVEHWELPGPRPLLEDGRFQALVGTLEDPDSTNEERHEAVQRLAAERSPRVVKVGARGAFGNAEHRPDLRVLESLHVVQHDDGALAGAQPVEGVAQARAQLERLGRIAARARRGDRLGQLVGVAHLAA
ncbi:MAG TPA: hypothetical protein VE153_08090, partial [Myxococcus sp.]|nr:hypothetical protein [Myxococcus sp.]